MLMDMGLDERRHEARRAIRRGAAVRARGSTTRRASAPGAEKSPCSPSVSRRRSRGPHPRSQIRQPLRQRVDVVAGPRHDDEVRQVEHRGIALPRRDFGERVGARDEEDLRRARGRARAADRACRRCRTVPRRAARRRRLRSLGSPDTASAAMAKRWNGEATGCTGRCGGTCDGTTSTRGRSNASRAATAAARWPQWIGSSVPPRIPMRVTRSSASPAPALFHDGFEQERQPLAGDRRYRVKRNPGALQMRAQPLEPLRIVERVDLVRRDDHRLVLQPLARRVASREHRQLARDHLEVLHRIAPDVDETSTTCTSTRVRSRWLRKRCPSPCPVCAPSISPGTSATTNDAVAGQPDDAEVRHQRGERIVGDLRLGGRDARDDRRLAGVGIADEARRRRAA